MAKIAVVGSRTFAYPEFLEEELDKIVGITAIISGGAAGADTYAASYAARRKIPLTVYKADWKRFGKSAGFLRNNDIVAACDEVVAFWDGISRGTAHTLKLAYAAKKPVRVLWKERP